MRKFKILIWGLLLGGCTAIRVPNDFVYQPIGTSDFTLASWQKITDANAGYKIYIEGDGYAFNRYGRATNDPTPKGTLVRELAFGDENPNVIYLARPCQYVTSSICAKRHWTTARFAPEIINAEFEAIKQIAGEKPVVLVGFSGGAQVAGLVAAAKTGLNTKKIITVAGNLDHLTWTQYHKLPPLNESMNLADYQKDFTKISQIHYVGRLDNNILPSLVRQFIKDDSLIVVVPEAKHNDGWDSVFQLIQTEN